MNRPSGICRPLAWRWLQIAPPTSGAKLITALADEVVELMLDQLPIEARGTIEARGKTGMSTQSFDRTGRPAASDDVRRVLGDVDDAKVAAILTLKPSLADLEDVAICMAGDQDILAESGLPSSGDGFPNHRAAGGGGRSGRGSKATLKSRSASDDCDQPTGQTPCGLTG
jgi:hypothetical protein